MANDDTFVAMRACVSLRFIFTSIGWFQFRFEFRILCSTFDRVTIFVVMFAHKIQPVSTLTLFPFPFHYFQWIWMINFSTCSRSIEHYTYFHSAREKIYHKNKIINNLHAIDVCTICTHFIWGNGSNFDAMESSIKKVRIKLHLCDIYIMCRNRWFNKINFEKIPTHLFIYLSIVCVT